MRLWGIGEMVYLWLFVESSVLSCNCMLWAKSYPRKRSVRQTYWELQQRSKPQLMGYEQGWHIGLLIYRLQRYRHFLKYRLSISIKVRTDKKATYRQFIGYWYQSNSEAIKYWLSVIGFGQTSVIDYRLNLTDMPSLDMSLYSNLLKITSCLWVCTKLCMYIYPSHIPSWS